jgi:hypothetical protein
MIVPEREIPPYPYTKTPFTSERNGTVFILTSIRVT